MRYAETQHLDLNTFAGIDEIVPVADLKALGGGMPLRGG